MAPDRARENSSVVVKKGVSPINTTIRHKVSIHPEVLQLPTEPNSGFNMFTNMPIAWMDALGPECVSKLAKEWKVELTPTLVQFLERFADKVSDVERAKGQRARRIQRARSELESVYDVVRRELSDLSRGLPKALQSCIIDLYVHRHVETRLPIAVLHLRGVPALVVHVNREYATARRGLTCGFRAREFCGGRLSGAVGRAANYLREYAGDNDWMLSVTELFQVWIKAVGDIPLKHRANSSGRLGHSSSPSLLTSVPARKKVQADDKRRASEPSRLSREQDRDSVELGVLFETKTTGHKRKKNRSGLGHASRANMDSASRSDINVMDSVKSNETSSTPASNAPDVGRAKQKARDAYCAHIPTSSKRPRKAAIAIDADETSPSVSHDSLIGIQGPPRHAVESAHRAVTETRYAISQMDLSLDDGSSSQALRGGINEESSRGSEEIIASGGGSSLTRFGRREKVEEVVASGGGPGPSSRLTPPVTADTMGRSSDFTYSFENHNTYPVHHMEEVIASGGGDGRAAHSMPSEQPDESGSGSGEDLSMTFTASQYTPSGQEEILASGGGEYTPRAGSADSAETLDGNAEPEEIVCSGGW